MFANKVSGWRFSLFTLTWIPVLWVLILWPCKHPTYSCHNIAIHLYWRIRRNRIVSLHLFGRHLDRVPLWPTSLVLVVAEFSQFASSSATDMIHNCANTYSEWVSGGLTPCRPNTYRPYIGLQTVVCSNFLTVYCEIQVCWYEQVCASLTIISLL